MIMKERKKMFHEMKVELRKKLAMMEKERPAISKDFIQPRYDEVFYQGLKDLDRMAGQPTGSET